VPVGSDMIGNAQYIQSSYSIDMSIDGYIVAIGARYSDGAAAAGAFGRSSQVRVYRRGVKMSGCRWQDIEGKKENEHDGTIISLSSNGYIVAIGGGWSGIVRRVRLP